MPCNGLASILLLTGLGLIVLTACPRSAQAGGMDCSKAATLVERAICADAQLRSLDDRLGTAYDAAFRAAPEPMELQREQRTWLRAGRDACKNSECLRSAYESRIRALETRYRGYTQQQAVPAAPKCGFDGLTLPADFAVLAGGAYGGRELSVQIDQSGHEATAMDVYVHYTAKPVVLMLSAYEPTIWTVKWSTQTRILAVVLGGYHRQGVAGLPRSMPFLSRTSEDRSPCGYFYVSANDLRQLNPKARELFGRPVDVFYPAVQGRLIIGTPAPASVDYISSSDVSPDSFIDANAPLAGTLGLQDAVKRGLIRPATAQDADDWVRAVAAVTPRPDVPPVAGQAGPSVPRPSLYRAYVVLRPFRYPAGLYGGNLAVFFIPNGVPKPTGNPGHSGVYDYNTLSCSGAMCGESVRGAISVPAPASRSRVRDE
jgi:uncharacterized protein